MNPVPRRRSTSLICGSIWPGSAPGASCSRCGCPARARRCTGPTPPRDRRRSWRATSRPSRCCAGHQPTRSAATTSSPRSPGCCSAGTAPSRPAGWRSGPITASTRSTATPASRVPMRRVEWRVRADGSAATIWSRFPQWRRWLSSTSGWSATTRGDDHRRIGNRTLNIGQHFALEVDLLRPLPGEVFETGLSMTPRVDRYARVTVRQCHYSVPAHLIGHRARAVLRASELLLSQARVQVARHERATVRGSQTLNLDHYLEVLIRKPGALPGATALAQARAGGMFTSAHEAFWAAARKAHGDSGGTRALVEVLLLHRHHRHGDVIAGITAALSVGALSPDVVAVETRKHQQHHDRLTTTADAAGADAAAAEGGRVVVSLTDRRQATVKDLTEQLPPDLRPLPSVAHYDSLLTGTTTP